MTKTEAAQLLILLVSAYPTPGWPEDTITLYIDMILDLDASVAREQVRRWIATESERPTIADLRRVVAEHGLDLPGPEEAYGMVRDVMGSHGNCDLPAAVREAVRLTGRTWEDLAYLQFDDYPWFRRDFLSAYREVRSRTLSDTQSRQGALPDRAEARALLDAIAKGSA